MLPRRLPMFYTLETRCGLARVTRIFQNVDVDGFDG